MKITLDESSLIGGKLDLEYNNIWLHLPTPYGTVITRHDGVEWKDTGPIRAFCKSTVERRNTR